MNITEIKFGSLFAIVFFVNIVGYGALMICIALLSFFYPGIVQVNGRPAANLIEALFGLAFSSVPFVVITAFGSLFSAALFRLLGSVMPKVNLELTSSPVDEDIFS